MVTQHCKRTVAECVRVIGRYKVHATIIECILIPNNYYYNDLTLKPNV